MDIDKTLLSRGMYGCYVYVCDDALRAHIKARLAMTDKAGIDPFIYPEQADSGLRVAEAEEPPMD